MQLIQKLSTRMPSLENRMSVLRQIADEKGITLQLGESSSSSSFGVCNSDLKFEFSRCRSPLVDALLVQQEIDSKFKFKSAKSSY